MITFSIPQDPELLKAIARTAIRHGQLDYVLRMAVRDFAALEIREALDATQRQGSAELRERVRKLAKQTIGEGAALCRLDALLTRAKRATERRNELLHGLWAADIDGQELFRHQGVEFSPQPSVPDLDKLVAELENISSELNEARLHGFLKEAREARNRSHASKP